MKTVDAIWDQDRPVLDRVIETFATVDTEAAKVLAEARDPSRPAPTEVPAVIKDTKRAAFYRHNLGLAYGKALSNRRVYEEALEALKLVKPEKVVDPSAYLFHRAVAEHGLNMKEDANRSILRLLDDAVETPDRYKMVSILMAFDMQSWTEADIYARLGSIARKMGNAERRLELSRGGSKTQKIQKDAIARLDEIIKELENQMKGDPNGGC
jgi:tetratricopeptide (TPR) repeat protein